MNGVLRESLVRMMPRLRAEEEVRLANTMAYASGGLEKRDAKKWHRARMKEMGATGHLRRAQTREEHHANLAALGFQVVINGREAGAVA